MRRRLALFGLCLSGPSLASEPVDRSVVPKVVAPVPLDLPTPQPHTLRPGITVHHLRVPGLRKDRVDVVFRRGAVELDGRPTAAVTAMGWLQDQATRWTGADALSVFEDVHDVDVWTDAGLHAASARLEAPPESLDDGLSLLREVIVGPRFRRQDLRKLRDAQLRWLLSEGPRRSDGLIDAALTHAWYPEAHPLGARPDVRGWSHGRTGDLRRRHQAILRSAPIDVFVVADRPWTELAPRLDALLDGVGVDASLPEPEPVEPPQGLRVIGVDLRGSGEVSLALRTAAPPLDHPDAPAFRLIDFAVGGTFLSRLNLELRETRGLTYGVGTDLTMQPERAHWTIGTQTRVDDLGETLDVIGQVLASVASDGLRQDEIDDGVIAAVGRWNQTLATASTAASVYGGRLLQRRDPDWARAWLDSQSRTTPERSREVAGFWLGADSPRVVVIIGERSQVADQLEERGFVVDWVPAELVLLGAL